MRTLSRLITATLGLLLAASPAAFAGAWTAKKGGAYNKIAFNYFESDDLFGENLTGFEEFKDLNINGYFEYGLQDNLTFFAT